MCADAAARGETVTGDPVGGGDQMPSMPVRHRVRRPVRRGRAARDTAVVGAAWLLGALWFFRAQWTSGFDRVMGNTGDTRLIVYLNEQWYLALRGSQAWRSPPFFFPTKGLLGYSDTFFVWQLFFAPFRLLGAEPFLAFQLTLVAMSLVAFVSFVVLVRQAFGTPVPLAAVGALVFVFANNLAGHVGSPQIFGIYLVPPVALLGLRSWRTRRSRPRTSCVLAAAFGALVALLLFTTYYVAWFALLGAGLVVVLSLAMAPRQAPHLVADAVRTGWRSLAAAGAGFVVGIVPFLTTYLPVIHQLGVRKYADALYFSTSWRGVFDVGAGDMVWGSTLAHLWPRPSPASYETSYAVTPLLWLAVVVGGGVLTWALVSKRVPSSPARRATVALCGTLLVVTLLPVDTSAGSLWIVVWHLPGATAIRAIDRIQVLADLLAAMGLVALATQAPIHSDRLRRSPAVRVATVVVLAAIVVEQADTTAGTQLHRSAELAALDAVPSTPAGCTSFFVLDSQPNHRLFYEFQTEAMLISQRLGIPTLNGYSGDEPPGWGLLFPNSPSYPVFVRQWTATHGLVTGVCELDLGTMRWTPAPSPPG